MEQKVLTYAEWKRNENIQNCRKREYDDTCFVFQFNHEETFFFVASLRGPRWHEQQPICSASTPGQPICSESTPEQLVCSESTPEQPVCSGSTPEQPVCSESTTDQPICFKPRDDQLLLCAWWWKTIQLTWNHKGLSYSEIYPENVMRCATDLRIQFSYFLFFFPK